MKLWGKKGHAMKVYSSETAKLAFDCMVSVLVTLFDTVRALCI